MRHVGIRIDTFYMYIDHINIVDILDFIFIARKDNNASAWP